MLVDGKRLLITGVLTPGSIAYAVAREALDNGAEVVLTGFGRTRSLTERTARRLPREVDVLELDVNRPADVRWRVVGLQAPVRLELEGAGPMGIALRAEYGIEQRGSNATVSGRMEFKGAAVMMVGPQLETEVGNSLRASLNKLKARVEAA